MKKNSNLRLKKIGINTYKESVIYMRQDCPVCRAEGFEVHARIEVTVGDKTILATLNMIENGFLAQGEVSLSNYAWKILDAKEGDEVSLAHPLPLQSLSYVRSKIYGNPFSVEQIDEIIHDIANGRYSDIHIATFLTACAAGLLNQDEITHLTQAMVNAGERLNWPSEMVVDKHCVGGLPGNRTSPIVVPIVTAFGLTMPKTSSRAITSPAGTADVMEVFTNVNLSLSEIRRVVELENGCMVWGGAVSLSPVDDILITVERAIDLDSEGQLIASVLSKKVSAGSTHIYLDIPVGPTAKIRSARAGHILKYLFQTIGHAMGLRLVIDLSDGLQPVGKGIGPMLEAQDVLEVLNNDPNASQDLKHRALTVAAALLEFSEKVKEGEGLYIAKNILESGEAWKKFQRICDAQGGMHELPKPKYTHVIKSKKEGVVQSIQNRHLARVAKLAGAPHDKAAGLLIHCRLGDYVHKHDPLFTVYAESKGELNYAINALAHMPDIFQIAEA